MSVFERKFRTEYFTQISRFICLGLEGSMYCTFVTVHVHFKIMCFVCAMCAFYWIQFGHHTISIFIKNVNNGIHSSTLSLSIYQTYILFAFFLQIFFFYSLFVCDFIWIFLPNVYFCIIHLKSLQKTYVTRVHL